MQTLERILDHGVDREPQNTHQITAELALLRGDRATAEREGATIAAEYGRGGDGWSARDRIAAGRAYLLVSAAAKLTTAASAARRALMAAAPARGSRGG